MSDHQPAYYQQYSTSSTPQRWPWVAAVVVALLIGTLVGYAGGLYVSTPSSATQEPTAFTSGGSATMSATTVAASEPVGTWPVPGSELVEPLEAHSPGTGPPPFPDAVDGFALSSEWRETVRAFNGTEWATIHEFPATMNGCSLQRFYVRWRAVNEQSTVQATFLSTDDIVLEDPVFGATGWMSGYGCGQPAFRMKSSTDGSTLTDVVVEVQKWEVSV